MCQSQRRYHERPKPGSPAVNPGGVSNAVDVLGPSILAQEDIQGVDPALLQRVNAVATGGLERGCVCVPPFRCHFIERIRRYWMRSYVRPLSAR